MEGGRAVGRKAKRVGQNNPPSLQVTPQPSHYWMPGMISCISSPTLTGCPPCTRSWDCTAQVTQTLKEADLYQKEYWTMRQYWVLVLPLSLLCGP